MITYKNKMPNPIKLTIGNDIFIVNEYEEYQFDNKTEFVDFTVEAESVKKASIFGYLSLAVIGIIVFILEMEAGEYLDFRKALSLPVKSKLVCTANDALVIIETPKKESINFCIITSDSKIETNTIIDKEEIHKQYKSFQKECFSVFSIPLLLAIAFLYFIFISKNTIAYIVGICVIILIFSVWYYHHKKNKQRIATIIDYRTRKNRP